MRLVWQVCLLCLACVLLPTTLITGILSYREAKYSYAQLREEQRLLAVTIASQVESGYHDQIWPFEMLWAVAKKSEFVFWQISDGDQRTVLAQGGVDPTFPRWPGVAKEPYWTVTSDGTTEEWIVPLAIGSVARPWTYRLGFRADEVRDHIRRIIATNTLVATATSVLLVGLSLVLARRLVAPVRSLTLVATELERGNLDVSLPEASNEETRQLVAAFRSMTESIRERDRAITAHLSSLEKSRADLELRVEERTSELLKAKERIEAASLSLAAVSRTAGMAEVATSVLHNVGNVLTSVNVSATILAETVRHSKVTGLGRAVALMEEHASELGPFVTSDPAGKLLPAYLKELSLTLEAEQGAVLQELDALLANVDHVKAVVKMQQTYARKGREVAEDASLPEIIDQALRIGAPDLQLYGVEVEHDYAPTPIVHVDRHKVIQILVNLVTNAMHALEGRADGRRLVVQTRALPDARLSVRVCDNGIGISSENLVKIFNNGFTTRKEGHGFGLHSSAVSAMELGGTLRAESDGPGRGAAFILTLPERPEPAASSPRGFENEL
jgi:signal transduction histidine kinase